MTLSAFLISLFKHKITYKSRPYFLGQARLDLLTFFDQKHPHKINMPNKLEDAGSGQVHACCLLHCNFGNDGYTLEKTRTASLTEKFQDYV